MQLYGQTLRKMPSALWILWLAELYRQSGLWHSVCPAVVLGDLWLAAGWQLVFSPQPQVWMLRIPCFWNNMWWWPVTRNKSLQRSAFRRVRWSTSLKRARVVSNQNKCAATTHWAVTGDVRVVPVRRTQTDSSRISARSLSNTLALFLNSAPSPPLSTVC